MNKLFKIQNYMFPGLLLINSYSLTFLVIVFAFLGSPIISMQLALIHAAISATFSVFSGNARNLILANTGVINSIDILNVRYILVFPLSLAAYLLVSIVQEMNYEIILIVIARKALEWITEVTLIQHEKMRNYSVAAKWLIAELIMYLIIVCLYILKMSLVLAGLIWLITPLFIIIRNPFFLFTINKNILFKLFPHIIATALIGSSTYIFRYQVIYFVGPETSGNLFALFAIGGALAMLFGQMLSPIYLRRYLVIDDSTFKNFIYLLCIFVVFLGFLLHENSYMFDYTECLYASLFGGVLMTISIFHKSEIIFNNQKNTLTQDLIANISILFLTFSLGFIGISEFFQYLYFCSGLINFIVYSKFKYRF